ncbi:MAG: HEAT repeat domain-containing protein [Nitrosopumilaceae archaeon]|nr:HEAT repeat domain-containing protein [Nitrosopumilaceae archaeon]
MKDFDEISQILDSGTSQEKINILEKLSNSTDHKIIKKIISKLDDPDIQVRGEAFSCLILNPNKISELLIDSLKDERKNVRGFTALVLANRKDISAISSVIPLTKDDSSRVRGCALGALGYLKAHEAKKEIDDCLLDENIEVRKSALKAIVDIGESIPEEKIQEISKNKDREIENLLVQVKKR